jgi:hypothetical protein
MTAPATDPRGAVAGVAGAMSLRSASSAARFGGCRRATSARTDVRAGARPAESARA